MERKTTTTRTLAFWTGALIFMIVVLVVANRVLSSGWEGHAMTHLSAATIAGFFFAATFRLHQRTSPRPKRSWKPSPIFLSGLGFLAVAQLVESVSAYTERAGAEILHDASGAASTVALGVIFVGVVHWVIPSVRGPRWFVVFAIIVAIIASALVTLLTIGLLPLG